MEGLEENIDIDPAICHPNTAQTRYYTRSQTHKSFQSRGTTFGRSNYCAVSDKHDAGNEVDVEGASFEDIDNASNDSDDDYAGPSKHCPHKMRTIVAASSLSMANEISRNQLTVQGFKFLAQEAYSCSCLLGGDLSLNNDLPLNCKVLVFFGLVFFKEWHVIFCPAHNCLIPMVKLARHLRKVHDDWTSPQKTKESQAMASHIADSLGLSPTQTQSDFLHRLPKELDSPFVCSSVFESYQCPKCFSWMAKNSANGNPDRYIRWKHLVDTCTARPQGGFKNVETIRINGPHWTYRVHLYPEGSHTFILRNWTEEETGSEFDPHLPKHCIPEILQLSSSNVIEKIQSWPLRVGWVHYEAEIAAASHFMSLQKLIASPKCRSTDFLEKSLVYLRSYSRKYLKVAVSLLKDSHEGIGQTLVFEYVLRSIPSERKRY